MAHRNSPKLAQIIRLIAILLSGEFQENRTLGSTDIYIYALVSLQTIYLEIFSCVCSDISNLAHRKSPKLAEIIRLISGEFQENRILGSTDILPWYQILYLGTVWYRKSNSLFKDML